MRRVFHLKSESHPYLKNQLLNLSTRFSYFQFLDSNSHSQSKYNSYDWIVAFGAHSIFQPKENEFEDLELFFNEQKDWLFGHLSYDLKNKIENLTSKNSDFFEFELMSFFIPKTVVYQKANEIYIESLEFENEGEFANFLALSNDTELNSISDNSNELIAKTSRDEYLLKIEKIKEHLQFGNIYELNFCIEFANTLKIKPIDVYLNLQSLSKAPFGAFYKIRDQYLLCASPERYLKKEGTQLISQPIKGTAKRSSNSIEDQALKGALLKNEKERSENVMIVDLVRNDLSKTASKGSVQVQELFGLYSFEGVHQMISTVTSELERNTSFAQALKHSYPMGSMTGAPKIKAMELIDELENFSRSLYSGAIGYISPSGDFDFNVVIRSLLYNAKTDYISSRVGSAITIHCDAEKEYEECLLKAENLFKSLKKGKLNPA